MNLADIALRPGQEAAVVSRPAFLAATGPVTNAEFQRQVQAIARGLLALDLQPGSKVLVRMTNSVEFAASFLALIWVGAVPVLQNSQFGRSELEHIIGLVRPSGLLFASAIEDPATEGLASHAWRAVVTGEGLTLGGAAVGDLRADASVAHHAKADDPAFIVFTSGTTGRPKGIVHAHRWLEALGDSNRARIPPQAGDVALATGEWSFISALGHNVLFPLRNGIPASILEERATPKRILETIARDRVTLLYSVATLYRRILGQPRVESEYDLGSLRGVNATGEPLETAVRAEWEARFRCPLWEHFGISEAQMVLGHGPLVPPREGTVGVAWGVRPAILDDALVPQPAGTSGRLAFAADYPGFFLGYLGDEAQTRQTFCDGWYLTSDLATVDPDGYVSILGRADDCFKSKGVLIVPRELEDALLAVGAFEEACVFAIPDNEIGNRIGAAIIPRAGTPPDLLNQKGLANALRGRLAAFKFPHYVLVLDAMPKNANGKTQRSAVVNAALEQVRMVPSHSSPARPRNPAF
jgi:acyl-coenzyme A synthetase/AMP-(fatty) acid ligase